MLTRTVLLLTSSLASLPADPRPPPLLVFPQVVSLASDPSVSAAPDLRDAELEAVLAGQVSGARCHAHCSSVLDCPAPQCARCRRVCDLLREGPVWTNLCGAPGLCSEGCQVACAATMEEDQDGDEDRVRSARNHDPEEGDLDLRLEQCSLLWSQEAEEAGRMYLVASEDRSGMFYHLGTVAHAWINLTPAILDKAERLIVLVIEVKGVVRRSQIEVT